MTDLAAPPVTTRISFPARTFRTQDRFPPGLDFATELPTTDDMVTGGTLAGGTNLFGDGVSGKRLWLRGADDAWIEIPYGAGQDSYTRSLNIYDAKLKTWMTPAWGWEVRHREAGYRRGYPQFIDAFNMRAVGRQWIGGADKYQSSSVYNPTYPSPRTTQQFTGQQPGYVRLFYMQKRVDPTWRIVAAGTYGLPAVPPVQTVDLDFHSRFFWPMAGVRTRYVVNNIPQYDHGSDGYTITRNTGIFVRQQINITTNTRTDPPWTLQVSSTIDLRAIRARLVDTYRERGVFFVGQYDPIELMGVRRVIMQVRPFIDVTINGTAPSQALLDNMTFRIWADTNTATEIGDFTNNQPGWNGETRSIRFPASHQPSGSSIFTMKGSDITLTRYQMTGETNEHGPVYQRSAIYDGNNDANFDPQYIFEGPGEDNISLYASVDNVPQLNTLVDSISIDLRYYISTVYIHYAEPGIDTPANTHVLGVIG